MGITELQKYSTDMDEDAQKTQFMTLIAEGEKLYNNGEPDKALEFYAQALTLEPVNKHALVARSKCYLRIGNVEAALNDANLSLKEDKLFHRGLYQKAEALYQKGDFEMALVNFHRGYKKRPELVEFKLGIEKSKEAIMKIELEWPQKNTEEFETVFPDTPQTQSLNAK